VLFRSAEDEARATGQWVEPDRTKPAETTQERTGLGLSKNVPIDAEDARHKRALVITLDHVTASIYRGNVLSVSGRITEAGAHTAAAGLRVEVALGVPGQERNLLLGVTVTDAQGYFQGGYGVPMSVDLGDYELRVITPGNHDYLPAIAE
jgi:hypothetical protein